jgi:uncharacterized membrane protein YgdD (TMEM256/DUF423 family)
MRAQTRIYASQGHALFFPQKSKEHPAKFIAVSALKFRRLFCLVKRVIEDERAKEVKEAKTVLAVSLAMVVVGAILFLPYLFGRDFGVWTPIGALLFMFGLICAGLAIAVLSGMRLIVVWRV